MKRILLAVFLFTSSLYGYSQPVQTSSYKPVRTGDWVKLKNYYLLSLIQQDKEVSKLLAADPELARLTAKKIAGIDAALNDCKDALCFPEANKLTADDISLVGTRLTKLYKQGNALDRLVRNHLIPSGTYSLYKGLSPAELLVNAWEQDAAGVNYVIDVYAEGKKPNYATIDSISFNIAGRGYPLLMSTFSTVLRGEVKDCRLAFEPSLRAALLYLQINERQDPAHYEPMDSLLNAPAVAHAEKVNWKKYPYSVILVPGAGPDNVNTPLSAGGMLRCRLGAQQYFAQRAPFILVSGGNVHPFKTKFNEAEEMRRYLIETLHVPEEVVILEPHARHTTTNLRNGARLIFRYGIPADKPGLIVTDKSHIDYIVKMDSRCIKELKYLPYKQGRRLSPNEVEFYPLYDAMQINPYEPLDP